MTHMSRHVKEAVQTKIPVMKALFILVVLYTLIVSALYTYNWVTPQFRSISECPAINPSKINVSPL